ncbi:MAG: hypothetical protein K8R86_07125, partial [Bacteroidales bacterium]|nr:hypothetical protein [Bacteroidales bacterium]
MKTKNLIYLSIVLIVGLASCEKDDPAPPAPPAPQSNVVIVDYNIFNPAIWYSDSIYLIPNTVKIDASLTIQPGTIIKLQADAGIEVWGNGTINAIGLQDSVIIFT